jgi:hypothetical protein
VDENCTPTLSSSSPSSDRDGFSPSGSILFQAMAQDAIGCVSVEVLCPYPGYSCCDVIEIITQEAVDGITAVLTEGSFISRVHIGLTEVHVCHRQLRVGPVLFRCICCSPFEAGLAYSQGKKNKPG